MAKKQEEDDQQLKAPYLEVRPNGLEIGPRGTNLEQKTEKVAEIDANNVFRKNCHYPMALP